MSGGGGVAVGGAVAEDVWASAALTATHSINPDAAAARVRRLRITIPYRMELNRMELNRMELNRVELNRMELK